MLQVVGAQMEEASLGHTGRAEDNLGNCPGGGASRAANAEEGPGGWGPGRSGGLEETGLLQALVATSQGGGSDLGLEFYGNFSGGS